MAFHREPRRLQHHQREQQFQHRRRDQALRELNNQQRQVEHATEIQDFLRDKFTAAEQYLWLQKETAALHSQMYADPACGANTVRFLFLSPAARRFYVDWERNAQGAVGALRIEAGRNPYVRTKADLHGFLDRLSEILDYLIAGRCFQVTAMESIPHLLEEASRHDAVRDERNS